MSFVNAVILLSAFPSIILARFSNARIWARMAERDLVGGIGDYLERNDGNCLDEYCENKNPINIQGLCRFVQTNFPPVANKAVRLMNRIVSIRSSITHAVAPS